MRKEVEKDLKIYTKKWSIRDLNPWPPHCQCGALPTALMPHVFYYSTLSLKMEEELSLFYKIFIKNSIQPILFMPTLSVSIFRLPYSCHGQSSGNQSLLQVV